MILVVSYLGSRGRARRRRLGYCQRARACSVYLLLLHPSLLVPLFTHHLHYLEPKAQPQAPSRLPVRYDEPPLRGRVCEHLRTPPLGLRQRAQHTHEHTLTTRPGGPYHTAPKAAPLKLSRLKRSYGSPTLSAPTTLLLRPGVPGIIKRPQPRVHPLFVTGGLTGYPSWRRPW